MIFVSNREIAHGTGDLVRMDVTGSDAPRLVQHEETSWHARPDASPDASRIVYSSYLGRAWQQLWLLPVDGGYPFPLTYGDYDNTNPRWSPDGRRIAFISNRAGNTALWVIDAFSGEEQPLQIAERRYLRPHTQLRLQVRDETGRILNNASIGWYVQMLQTRGRLERRIPRQLAKVVGLVVHLAKAPRFDVELDGEAYRTWLVWVGNGRYDLRVGHLSERLAITVSHGPSYEVAHVDADPRTAEWSGTLTVTLRRLTTPTGLGDWWSGDLHVHMNYGGLYRNTPSHLAEQGQAENLNLIYDLVVNKEQRVPDIASFRADVDPASTQDLMILHGQEFHTSYWGHLAILNLTQHLLLPGYAGYPFTAAGSPYPHNAAVTDMAHRQHALVGYAHPFDEVIDPNQDTALTNELPVDAALGKVDYYEAVGFADPKATNTIWYRLLECGLQIPAGAGTDAMANYASLRGPVGVNRVYVPATGPLTREAFLAELKSGRGIATNGPLVHLTVEDASPGDTLRLTAGAHSLTYRATLRANFLVDHLELIWNGEVIARLSTGQDRRAADVTGSVDITRSGWLLLRAWNDGPQAEVLDNYPYATTSPVYVEVAGRARRSREAATYFLRWVDGIRAATEMDPSYRTDDERAAVLQDVARARTFYEQCVREAAGSDR